MWLGGLPAVALAFEPSALPPMATPQAVLKSLDLEALKRAAAQAREQAKKKPFIAPQWVRIEAYQYSDGSFNVWEPFLPINLRAWRRGFDREDYDFDLSGTVAREVISGQARSRFFRDPTWGFIISGQGFYANLDKFGDGWTLRGHYQIEGPNRGSKKVEFDFRLERGFPEEYRVWDWDRKVDLRIQLTRLSATVEGFYEKDKAAPIELAIIGTCAGLINTVRSRQEPFRP